MTSDLQDGAGSTWTRLAAMPRTEGHPFNIVVLNDGTIVATDAGLLNSQGTFDAASGVFTSTNGGQSWTDTTASTPAMQYFCRDITIDPSDPTQSTWWVPVWATTSGKYWPEGGLFRTTNRGQTWTQITGAPVARDSQITINPNNHNEAYLTAGDDGLWISENAQSASPTFTQVTNYPFAAPTRVFFDPYDPNQVWVSSFGYGLVYGYINAPTAASKLIFAKQPTTTAINTVIAPPVTVGVVVDADGDLITSDNSTVTLSLGSGPGTLGGTLTAQAVNGIATFNNLTLRRGRLHAHGDRRQLDHGDLQQRSHHPVARRAIGVRATAEQRQRRCDDHPACDGGGRGRQRPDRHRR